MNWSCFGDPERLKVKDKSHIGHHYMILQRNTKFQMAFIIGVFRMFFATFKNNTFNILLLVTQ